MSYQLPPNLLRLFQPRPNLSVVPAVKKDKDPRKPPASKKSIDERTSRLEGVGHYLEKFKQEAADKGEATMDVEDEETKEKYTLAEQTKREMRREEKKKAYEENKSRQLAECETFSNTDRYTTVVVMMTDTFSAVFFYFSLSSRPQQRPRSTRRSIHYALSLPTRLLRHRQGPTEGV